MYVKHLDIKVPYYEAFSPRVVSNINLSCVSVLPVSSPEKSKKLWPSPQSSGNLPFVTSQRALVPLPCQSLSRLFQTILIFFKGGNKDCVRCALFHFSKAMFFFLEMVPSVWLLY